MIIIFLLVLYISPTAASRTLVEYEIQMEHLQISSENNISKAELKFVFRRRMEFHVANTFLQTFLLTAVGSMSFYFDINNFGPKMQVTVTTMLVVATISNSIRNVRNFISKKNSIDSMCLELQFSRPRWRWVSAATIAADCYV